MPGQRLLRQRSKREDDDFRSAITEDGLFWRATYTYVANGFRYTDEASVRDVSRTGCGIRGRARLTVGSQTTVTFYLADGRRPLTVPGRVVSVTGEYSAVEFLRLSAEAYGRIQEYIRNALKDPAADPVQPPGALKEHRKPLRLAAVFLLMLGSLSGCGALSAPSVVPTPFLVPTTDERRHIAQRASELDARAQDCREDDSCEQGVHFSRALVSLFENRDAARAAFEKVISLNATTPVATSSALWLEVLKNETQTLTAAHGALLSDLATHWLTQWMSRSVRLPSVLERTQASEKPTLIHSLRQDVRDRERRIAHLEAQLQALKVISDDQEDRRRVKTPDSLLPKLEKGR